MKNKSLFRQALAVLAAGLLILPQTAFAQNKVSGTVKDSWGDPVIGAAVVQKGTTNGISTSEDGTYSISVPAGAILQFSCVGYKTVEMTVTGETLDAVLEDDVDLLEGVVVVGYGTQKKANLTGSVASVSSRDIEDIPAANAASLLQGRLPGVVLTSNGGQAGKDNPEIRVRGVGTLSGNNNPMVIIDGIEAGVDDIRQIAAADIDNVSVLKDAASAAIYGVRAANGVILITTKRGFESAPKVNYSGNFTLQKAAIMPDYVDSCDWALMYNESKNTDIYTADMLAKLRNGSDPDHFANTDWVAEMFRVAPMHQHNLSVRGGSKNAHYAVSAGYLDQEGILKYSGYRRYNFRSNVDATRGRFTFGLNLAGSLDDTTEPGGGVGGENGVMRMLTWFTRPTVPAVYSNGYYGCVDGTDISHTVFKNPLQTMAEGHRTNYGYHFDGKVFAEADIWQGIKFKTSLAYSTYLNTTSSYSQKSSKYDAEGNLLYRNETNSLYKYMWMSKNLTNENLLTWNRTLNEKHDFNVLLGHSTIQYRYDTENGTKQDFASDNLYEFNAGTSNDKVAGSAEEYALQSFFGRVGYIYDNRYLFEMNIRHDGSSRMPSSHRYATFPSFSAGWNISNEDFFSNVDFINHLKIRASWGKLGNQEIGNYPYAATMAASYNYYFGSSKSIGLADNIVANDDIRWETTTMTDLGFDVTVWNGKISATFDWFDKLTSDILLKLPLPSSFLGTLGSPYQNVGKVRNRGWEFSASYNDRAGDWSWNANVQLSAVKNTIVDNGGIETISGNTINREGNPIGSYYGLKAIGMYRTEADLTKTDSEGRIVTTNGAAPVLGNIIYEDFNCDGNIDANDRQIIGNPFPKLAYSFSLGFTWKSLDFNTFWQGVAGVYRYNWEQTTISNGGNMTKRWLDRYSSTNTDGSMPAMGEGHDYNSTYSTFWLGKADYLRLKNIELGYTFAGRLLEKIGCENARVYLQGTNLLTFTPLKDYDPEKSSGDTRGDVHPNTKTVSVGVNINF